MPRDLSPMSLTIQEFMGALLPGMVWAVEFFTLNQIVGVFFHLTPGGMGSAPAPSLLQATGVLYPSTFQVALSLVSGQTTAFYTGFVVCSLILGYITSSFPTLLSECVSCKIYKIIKEMTDILCLPPRMILHPFNAIKKIREKYKGKIDKFPYDITFFKETAWLKQLLEENFLKDLKIDIDSLGQEYQRSCFHICKKFLRGLGPDYVRDRIMYIEAQNRMLSSLLLASISNVFLVFLALSLSSGDNFLSLMAWLLFSTTSMGVLCYTFQYRRRAEVSAVYNYMIFYIRESRRIKEDRQSTPAGRPRSEQGAGFDRKSGRQLH